jgi:hypothetical protein
MVKNIAPIIHQGLLDPVQGSKKQITKLILYQGIFECTPYSIHFYMIPLALNFAVIKLFCFVCPPRIILHRLFPG